MAPSSSTVSEIILKPGQLISDRWRIVVKLGKGGFGSVYKVTGGQKKQEYAMKVESVREDESMMKMEVAVLKTFSRQETPPRHACKYYDNGETSVLRDVVMELVGPNLGELRRTRPNSRFSESTTVRLGVQCLEALEDLHKISFIHRDVKPANFAMGTGAFGRIAYILDYGLSRHYLNRDGGLREPRKVAGFRGTVRYASINVHLRKDQGRHDDLWSLLYILIEFRRGELPWTGITDKVTVGQMKKESIADKLLEGMPQEFRLILNELHGLQFGDTPNYGWFHQQIMAVLIRKKYRESDPFDWEGPSRRS